MDHLSIHKIKWMIWIHPFVYFFVMYELDGFIVNGWWINEFICHCFLLLLTYAPHNRYNHPNVVWNQHGTLARKHL